MPGSTIDSATIPAGSAVRLRNPQDLACCLEARATLLIVAILAIAGLLLGWNLGNLPSRPAATEPATGPAVIAPDLALYRDIIREVRSGRNYYSVASEKIPQYGFPIRSPLNWRLPTYAWTLSLLPNKCWIQAVLLLLAITGLG